MLPEQTSKNVQRSICLRFSVGTRDYQFNTKDEWVDDDL